MSVTAPPAEHAQPVAASAPRHGGFWLPIYTLMLRELVRFFRQRTRVIGALGQPVLFWILFGAGLRGSFEPPEWAPAEMTYQEYFFPGVAVLIVMFTAIFSTISIIEDRREGFLQGVLVAPISRLSLVLGKLSGRCGFAERLRLLEIELPGDSFGRAFDAFQIVADGQGEVHDEELRRICCAAAARENECLQGGSRARSSG